MAEKYEAIETFKDNDGTVYAKNERYKGMDEERIKQLSTKDNKLNRPFIRKINSDDTEYPVHVGGGHYELSNGEKVQGKDKAIEAEQALKD